MGRLLGLGVRGGHSGTKGILGGILGGFSSSLALFKRAEGLGGMGTRGGISGFSVEQVVEIVGA